jgi:hypothetical protein
VKFTNGNTLPYQAVGLMASAQTKCRRFQSFCTSGGDGKTRIQVRLENETVWLTQQMMADLSKRQSEHQPLFQKSQA